MSRRAAPSRVRDDCGFTMVEMMVVVVVMGVLLAIAVPIVSTVFQTSSRVDVTYSNVDEQLWLSTTFQRLLRAAIAPDPIISATPDTPAIPVPAFKQGTITPTSMTFYTDTGTPRGPEMVKASCTPVSTTDTTACKSPTATFSVVMYKAQKTPTTGKSFCPDTTGTTKQCLYTSGAYQVTERTLVTIPHVRNGANGDPLFLYAYGPEPVPGEPMTTTTVCAPGRTTTCSSNDAATFDVACLAGTETQPFANCQAGEIESVTYDLQINGRTTSPHGGEQAEADTGVFVLSSTSMQYEPAVG